ncbi:BREX system serine/threonine kinase PglW [Mycobacterium intracellulare subsp. intracellulare]|uniref:BREX system serine/threonine kinase PglW n=1 Tax=Mycobacterium intracellulare TaxID=1767 RepID=UPI0001B45633|nr:BREX system serine/threonine kinase PglW [Mycobacterium intracellulare]UGU05761.1 BREX system serine/threonine kinase PglW [Mycobacterium intracellulare subsp. intracellulare]BCO59617.1 protein kinase [Mycobacterium intracellulare]BCO96797.1 protein kinase [Mycobacterium intracellulare]
MQPNGERWHVVTDSEHPHEKEGLEHVRELLPDRSPFHAWSNFEFVDSNGTWSEVDLLVLGEGALYLVELKHYQGDISGNAYRWQLSHRSEDSPLKKTAMKARRLAGVLKNAAVNMGLDARTIPFVKPAVFLHSQTTRCLLSGADKNDLYGLDGREQQTNLPSIAELLLEPPRRESVNERDFLRVIEHAGFALRREREIGSWRLIGQALDEDDDWQDWPAEHRVTRKLARIRFFTTPQGASKAQVAGARRLAEREYGLTSRLHHPGILAPQDIVEDELGRGLVFPYDPDDQRLDLWLADNGEKLDLRAQMDLVRQLAESVQYAHSNGIVHRGLNPSAVVVHDDGPPRTLIGGWSVAGAAEGASPSVIETQGSATRIFGLLEARKGETNRVAGAYVAPEGQWRPDANRSRLDVFALGSLTYLLVAGHDPATSAVELKQRLEREHGLDLAADLPQVPESLRGLVLAATNPVVSDRLRDVNAFLEMLSRVERELGTSNEDTDIDPLDAPPGTLIGGRFELVRRLGSGSTAVGLLVRDAEADGEARVLKVAIDDNAAKRLDAEVQVLAALTGRKHPRIIRIVETVPVKVGDRKALLLESAGEETLADVLRDRRRLSLDLLDRWGTDLLEALVSLDEAGVDHRDIKPSNLGVREQKSDRAKHLVLFDFSLAKASAATISAGTPPYLDPFLGSGTRLHWDSAAERYAAAVTLFEMATGHAPIYGDGETAPQFVERATIEPGDFDPAIADAMVQFFERALAKEVKHRHDTASDMLTEWRSALAGSVATTPAVADEAAERATPETPLQESGLTPRALSALEPFRLKTVGDLAAIDTSRLSRFTGIVDATKREIRGRAKQWREKFGSQLLPSPVPAEDINPADPFTSPQTAAALLVESAGTPRAQARRTAAAVLLGLEGDVAPFAVLADHANALGLGGQAQASMALASLRDAWAKSPQAAGLLDGVFDRVLGVLEGLDGAAWTESIVDALAPTSASVSDRRLIAGMVRAALDRAEDKAKGADEESPIARRRRRKDNRLLLARTTEVADLAQTLGARATQLVNESASAGEFVVPRGRSVPAFRQLWTSNLPALDDTRLVRLAARLSDGVAASASGELYSTSMPVVIAVRLALGSTMPSQRFSAEEVRRLVQVRLPGVADVPGRPGLDRVLAEAGTGLTWDGEAYSVPSAHSDTTFLTQTSLPVIPIRLESQSHPTDRLLRESISARSFLALGIPAKHAPWIAAGLITAFHAFEVNITDVLLQSLKESGEAAGLPWDAVLAADAAAPESVDARGLAALVEQSIPGIDAAIAGALSGAPGLDRPVVITEAAPLARYGHMSVLSKLADIATKRDQAVWLVVPEEGGGGPLLDRVPIPLTYSSQFVRVDDLFVASEGDQR